MLGVKISHPTVVDGGVEVVVYGNGYQVWNAILTLQTELRITTGESRVEIVLAIRPQNPSTYLNVSVVGLKSSDAVFAVRCPTSDADRFSATLSALANQSHMPKSIRQELKPIQHAH